MTCIALALGLHATCMALVTTARVPARAAIARTTQVEVAVVAKQKPQPEAPASEPAAPEPASAPKRARRSQPPPEPARAAPVLTRAEAPESPTAAEPVRFVSDPNGKSFGYGLVARGGSAERGEASPAPHAAATVTREEPIATRLSRAPLLLAHDGCRGFFPNAAPSNAGTVSVIATVRASGAIARLDIEQEAPAGQGFGRAARACLERQRFTPALDPEGATVAARTRIRIQFER
jgi:TonB family protein